MQFWMSLAKSQVRGLLGGLDSEDMSLVPQKNKKIGSKSWEAFRKNTPRKTNMSPKNQWLEDVFPIEIVHL